jgi:ATP-dependent protease ClpP protease subunit
MFLCLPPIKGCSKKCKLCSLFAHALIANFFDVKKTSKIESLMMHTKTNKPYEVTNNAAAGYCEIKLIGAIDWWSDDNNSVAFTQAIDKALEAGIQNVRGYLNTYGGDVIEANEIKNQIERFPGLREATIGAVCASAGTMVLMGFQKERIKCHKNTFLMYHDMSSSYGGTVKQMESRIEMMKKLTGNYIQELKSWCGKSEEDIIKMLDKETWLTAEDAIKENILIPSAILSKEDTMLPPNVSNYSKNLPAMLANAIQKGSANPNPKTQMFTEDVKNQMIGKLGISANATETEILNAINALQERSRNAEMNATIKANKICAAFIVDHAVEQKKIVESEKEQWLKDAEQNPELVARLIKNIPSPRQASSGLSDDGKDQGGADDRKNWTLKDWKEKDPQGLVAMHEKDRAKYDSLVKAAYPQK